MNQEGIMGNSSTSSESDQHVERYRKEEKEMVYTIEYYRQEAERLKEMLHQSRMENQRLYFHISQGKMHMMVRSSSPCRHNVKGFRVAGPLPLLTPSDRRAKSSTNQTALFLLLAIAKIPPKLRNISAGAHEAKKKPTVCLCDRVDQYDDCPGEQGAFNQKERRLHKFVSKNKYNVEEQNATSDERRNLYEAYIELMAQFRNLQWLTKKQSEIIQNLTCHKQQNKCPESIPIQCTDLEASEALQVTSYTRFPSLGLLLPKDAKSELSATRAWAEKRVKIEEQPIIHVPQGDLKPPPTFKAIATETTSSVDVSPSKTTCNNITMYIRNTDPSQQDEGILGGDEKIPPPFKHIPTETTSSVDVSPSKTACNNITMYIRNTDPSQQDEGILGGDEKIPPPFKHIPTETTSSVDVSPSKTACYNATMYIRNTKPSRQDADILGDDESFLQTVDSLSLLGLKRPPPDSDYLSPFINSTNQEHLCEEIRRFRLNPKGLCKPTASCDASNKKIGSPATEKRVMPKGIVKYHGTGTDHNIPARFPQLGKERKDVKVPPTEDIGNICLTPRSIGTDEFAFIARTCPICTIVIYVRPGNEDEMQHHVNTHLDNDLRL
uniref:uncharacterized protein isoform X2 n=1 Tax=Myxine glutinosa TaxID=7769 RepID=UPI00358DDA91